jgi:hypothetical protein
MAAAAVIRNGPLPDSLCGSVYLVMCLVIWYESQAGMRAQ